MSGARSIDVMWIARLMAIAIALLMLPQAASAQRGVALILGNSKYLHTAELKNPLNDANDMAKKLGDLGFAVILGIDLTKIEVERKIRDFSRALSGTKVAVFFYAGHGLQVSGVNYIVPTDAKLEDYDSLDFELIKMDVVQRQMEKEERTNILFLDACRDNPLARNLSRAMGTRSTAIGHGLAKIESGIGTLISFSTQPGAVAADGAGRNSPFTKALVKEIDRPGRDIISALIDVRNQVITETNSKQIPWDTNALRAHFYFSGQPATPGAAAPQPVPAPAAPAQSEAGRMWEAVKGSDNPQVLESFARQFKDTVYGALAQERLAKLTAAKQPSPAPVAVPPPVAPPKQIAQPSPPPAAAPTAIPSQVQPQPKVAMNVEPTPAPAATRGVVKVGVAGPMTGPNAAFGAQLKNGAEQAAADLNKAGGIGGNRIELIVADDQSDPRQGVSVANKLVGDGVKLVVGHFNSGVTMAASDVYQQNGVLMITPSSTNPRVTERGMWNVFRTSGRDDQQGPVAARYIADNFKGRKIALVHDKTTYGKGLADGMQAALGKLGVREVLFEGVNNGDKDFSALVSKVKAAGADLVYWGGLSTEGGLIVRQMRDAGVRAVMMGGDGIADSEFAIIAGPGAEGTLMTFTPDARRRPEAASVLKAFEARRFNPEGYTLYSYAALQVLAGAASATGTVEPRKVAEALKSGKPIKTVLGDLAYDAKGDTTRLDYVIWTWKKGPDGRLTYVQN